MIRSSLALCTLATLLCGLSDAASSQEVRTTAEFINAVESLQPGTTIRLTDGEYASVDIAIAVNGTADQPVVIEAVNPGMARLTGRTSLRLEGSHIVLKDLYFDRAQRAEGREALISFRSEAGKTASYSRVTNVRFDRCNPDDPMENYPWIRMYGHRNRIDHCRFVGQDHKGLAIQIRVYEPNPAHHIHHNHFVDRLPGAESNGYEVIQVGLSGDSLKPGNTVIEDNIFERCDGETEIISSKSGGNIIRRNLFLESSGSVTLRHGNNGQVVDNAFVGFHKAGTGGVRVVGEGNIVRGNYFHSLTGRTGGAVVFYCGIPDSPLNGYFAADNALVEDNIFIGNSGNSVYLNAGFGQRNRVILPKNLILKGNVFGKPTNGGLTAISGSNPNVVLKDNHFDDAMETGFLSAGGLTNTTIRFIANKSGYYEPYAVVDGKVADQPLLSAPRIPRQSEVGPKWDIEVGELLLLNPARLRDLKSGQSASMVAMREGIIQEAASILAAGRTYSVTFNDRVPPSGDLRDYYSTGPYWWPNPDTPDGLPYIQRDGEFNPERDRVSDRQPLHDMIRDTRILALAQTITGDNRYGDWAALLLRVWFLDAETGMRPHLNHAQAIPGITEGRGTGLIDSHPFAELIDALLILDHTDALTANEGKQLRRWFADFAAWFYSSKNGAHERAAKNNHGTAYDLQYAALLWYTGQLDRLEAYLTGITVSRIEAQITPAGLQPLELKRTRTWSYCTENLEHFFKTGLIAAKVGVDLFHYRSAGGVGIQPALDYLLPYVCSPNNWPHPQQTEWQNQFIRNVLSIASGVYAEPVYAERLECVTAPDQDPFAWLLYSK